MTSLREKILQMFILGLEGDDFKKNPNLKNALNNGLGGVIFFSKNITNKNSLQILIKEIKRNAKTTPFLSIDQEGGRVERTENLFGGKKYLSARYAAQKGEQYLKTQTKTIAKELSSLGFNLNFAPCVDVNTNPNNPIIGARAFSNETDEVIRFGKIVAAQYIENGIMPCLKHYPGHGDANTDSHISLPEIKLEFEEMEKKHIAPFREIKAPIIMVAHLYCSAFDTEYIPTSLSKNAIDYLKNTLLFDGLLITDDMNMGGVLGYTPLEACIKAIKAGIHILLYRSSDDETINIIEKLIELAERNDELKEKIDAAYTKIISIKSKFL